jgi:signal transduction histidine kinase/CheY-like chemotaxis protein
MRLIFRAGKTQLWEPACHLDRELCEERLLKALDEESIEFEHQFRVMDEDRIRWLREKVGIERIGTQRWNLMGVVSDVTEQVEVAETNRRNMNQFRSILERVDCMPWQATVIQTEDGKLDWTFDIPPSVLQKRIFRSEGSLRTKRLYSRDFEVSQLPEMNRHGAAAILSGSPGYEQEFKLTRNSDRKSFWLHEHVSIHKEASGRWQLYGLMVDITSRHQALEARRESELQLQEVLMRVECILWHAQVHAVSGGLYIWNIDPVPSNMFYLLFECKPEDRAPTLWDAECVPEHEQLVRRSNAAIAEGAAGYEHEFRFVRGGRTTWLHEQVTLHSLGEGRWHAVGVAVDITDRRRAEHELANEKERLAVTLRAMEEGVLTLDGAGCVQFMNRAAEAMLGCDSRQAHGHAIGSILHLIHAATGAGLDLPLSEVLGRGCVIDFPVHSAIKDPSGRTVEIDGCCVPLRDQSSRVTGAVVVMRDMTDRLRLELQLQRSAKLETLGILAGGIAHDFNNILTAVMGNIGLAMLEATGNKGALAYLGEAQGASERARDLTQQLLTFAKGGDPVRTAVNLADVAHETAQFAVRGSRVKCEFDMPDELWPANADKGQLSQIIQNLAINSLQAMPEGGTLRLCACNETVALGQDPHLQPGDYVRLVVSDTGPGIPAAILPKIFDPYFTTKKQGSGLGLATVFSIVKKHRGYIDVDSQPGLGASFIIRLPALKDASSAGVPGVVAPIPSALSARVLVMDDEESIRRLVERMLTRLGLKVELTADGAEAVTRYQAAWRAGTPYDLVIMDLTVPGSLGGCEALAAIKGINPAVKAIVASGYSSDPVMADFETYGFCAMVVKPFDSRELASVVARVLGAGVPSAPASVQDAGATPRS